MGEGVLKRVARSGKCESVIRIERYSCRSAAKGSIAVARRAGI